MLKKGAMMRQVSCDRCGEDLGKESELKEIPNIKGTRFQGSGIAIPLPRAYDIGRVVEPTDLCTMCLDQLETWFVSGKKTSVLRKDK